MFRYNSRLRAQRVYKQALGARFSSSATSSSPIPAPESSANVHLGRDLSIYSSLVEELRKGHEGHSPRLSISKKAFNEISGNRDTSIANEDKKLVAWSSSYDPVTRSPFAKDVTHLQSLLDALLSSKNFSRAENILKAIHPLLDESSKFSPYLNKYLEAYAQDESVNYSDVKTFLGKITLDLGLVADDRTTAILVSKAMDENMDYAQYLQSKSRYQTRQILRHIDIISLDHLSTIFQNPELTEAHIPVDLRPMYHELTTKRSAAVQEEKTVPKYFKQDGADAPTLDKDMSELRAVESFGLKVIRHALLGLQSKELLDLQQLLQDMDADRAQHLVHNKDPKKRRNYHEIYKSLKTQEDKDKFNKALELFNHGRQRELESKGVDAAREKWKHEFEDMQSRGALPINKNLNVQLYQWYLDMLPLVEEEEKLCAALLNNEIDISLSGEEKTQMKNRSFYAPYLVLIPPKKLTVITILEMLKLNSTGGIVDGMRTARAVISIGRAIELEYRSQALISSEKKFKATRSSNHWRRLLRSKKKLSDSQESEWEVSVHAKLGSVLASFLLHVSKITVTGTDPSTGARVQGKQPAFYHTYQFVGGQRLGIIKLHKRLIAQLASNKQLNAVQPQLLPMLLPPIKWTAHNSGGYYFSPSAIVRIRDSAETIAYVKAAAERGNLDEVYQGLNVLGETPWTINAKVLDVVSHFWNTGKEFLDIPPIVEEPKLPEPLPSNAEPLEKAIYQKKVRHILNEAAAFRSQRCDTNYKLEIARAFVGEKMYFPHNVDFRGRAYPLAPHLNHLGNDLTRSLFLFWESRKLGAVGLRWLKIHLANLYGMDKAPLDEREAFVDANLEQVFRSAEAPLENVEWWKKADKPWQVLSVCFELNEAYKLADPTEYESNVPVHQDGTCNGLQHYAALGGDIEGARQVNLVPADRPQDVYKFVAGLVEKRLEVEAAAGNEYAKFLSGKITRKVVKQTVMTNVYGVTFVGAVAQIEKQLTHLFDKDDYNLVKMHARFLTSLVFASVRELFEGAHLIQDWLGESAKRISKSVRIDYQEKSGKAANKPNHHSSVIWTTPLGLPCVQPYRATQNQVVSTNLQDISIQDPFGATQVDARKQQTAFPPNFIHSLDATHMLMTAAACGERKMDFASVHDSYWTHACNVDRMNVCIREQFVRLHEDNLIVKLRDEFERRYKGFLQVVSIPSDHELAQKIKKVRKTIVLDLGRALTVADELYIEKKRQELLESPDSRLNQMGKDMVTTISVVEGYDVSALKTGSGKSSTMQVLVPLKFPDIPVRGDFDVSTVKDSLYFFS